MNVYIYPKLLHKLPMEENITGKYENFVESTIIPLKKYSKFYDVITHLANI